MEDGDAYYGVVPRFQLPVPAESMKELGYVQKHAGLQF